MTTTTTTTTTTSTTTNNHNHTTTTTAMASMTTTTTTNTTTATICTFKKTRQRTTESPTRINSMNMTSLSHCIRLFIVTSLLKAVTCNMREMMMFQMMCNDDVQHIGSLSTDCNKYQMCSQGIALPFSCPQGYIFNDAVMRCHLPSHAEKAHCSRRLLSNMPFTCLYTPHRRVASYLSCAQYFDCNARPSNPYQFVNYVTECPYPQLFSTETGRCEPFQRVQCVGRTEPKAPCDYLQYQQLCEGPKCSPCAKRHPSCVGLSDGAHAIRRRSRVYIVCLAERTVNIGRCRQNYVFSQAKRACVPKPRPAPPPRPISPLSTNQMSSFLAALSSNSTLMERIKNFQGDQDSSNGSNHIHEATPPL